VRKPRLVDCRPRWGEDKGVVRYITFDCPEGHEGCEHTIAFSPGLDGVVWTREHGALWLLPEQTVSFETLTLQPSIQRRARYVDRAAALAAGCLPDYITETMFCRMHVNLTNGVFEFAGDSG
jgi:hypothetical protein